MNTPASHTVHLSIAETGKLFALKNNHTKALQHYREAFQLAVSSKAPEVFFRHYTQCVLESLELTGSYDEIIEYCVNADAHYTSLQLNSSLHKRDHGSILERWGLVLLKKGETEQAKKTLINAKAVAGEKTLPITEEVLAWLIRGYSVDTNRILASQRKHNYFVVRAEQVDDKRAIPLTTKTTQTFDPTQILSR